MIPYCDARLCSKIDQVDKNRIYYTKHVMPFYVAKLIMLINTAFMIPNCDVVLCNSIDQVDKHGFNDTKR